MMLVILMYNQHKTLWGRDGRVSLIFLQILEHTHYNLLAHAVWYK